MQPHKTITITLDRGHAKRALNILQTYIRNCREDGIWTADQIAIKHLVAKITTAITRK